jgi:hypothetical protein
MKTRLVRLRLSWRTVAKAAALAPVALVVALPACGGEASEAAGSPTTTAEDVAAPWGLADVVLPDDRAAVQALFEGFPREIAGRARAQPLHDNPVYIDVPYGASRFPAAFLRAIPIEALSEFAARGGLTPVEFFRLSRRGDAQIDETGLDPNDPVVYVVGRTTETADAKTRTLYTAMWAEPDGEWIFVAVAESPELRAAAAEAFVAAAKDQRRR